MKLNSTSTQPDTTDPTTHRLSTATTLILAVASGLSVANIYYAQPLLDLMARDLALPIASAGLVVTLTQIGYAFGLILAVPLGDLIDPRRVAVGQSMLSVVALIVVGTARSEYVLLAGMLAVGFFAVVVQVLVAFAATLSAPTQRGKAVGLVTSGVVIGILAARFVSGVIADLGGWRSVYLASAGMTLIMAITLACILPRHRPQHDGTSYLSVLRSIPAPFLNDPVVRLRGLLALLIFASFSALWTSLVLPLSAAPYVMTAHADRPIRSDRHGGSDSGRERRHASRQRPRGPNHHGGTRNDGCGVGLGRPAPAIDPGACCRHRAARLCRPGRPRHQPEHHLCDLSECAKPAGRWLHVLLLGRQRPRRYRLHRRFRLCRVGWGLAAGRGLQRSGFDCLGDERTARICRPHSRMLCIGCRRFCSVRAETTRDGYFIRGS